MLLKTIADNLSLKPRTDAAAEIEVTAGYASDLLSDVLARAKAGTLWVTNHKHQNIVGVAVMLNLAGVVITGGLDPDEKTLEKAIEEKIPLYTTDATMFDVVGRLHELGVRSS